SRQALRGDSTERGGNRKKGGSQVGGGILLRFFFSVISTRQCGGTSVLSHFSRAPPPVIRATSASVTWHTSGCASTAIANGQLALWMMILPCPSPKLDLYVFSIA